MALTATVTPGVVLAADTLVDNAKLNLLGNPTVEFDANLSDLTDVDGTDAPASGEALVYNGTKWAPKIVAGSCPSLSVNLRVWRVEDDVDSVHATADFLTAIDASGFPITLTDFDETLIGTATGAGGLEGGGGLVTETWYYIWAISNGTDTAIMASTKSDYSGAGAPTLPTGYTYKSLISAVRTETSGDVRFRPFVQVERDVYLERQEIFTARTVTTAETWEVLNAVGSPSERSRFQAAVPPIAIKCRGNVGASAASTPTRVMLSPTTQTGATPTIALCRVLVVAATQFNANTGVPSSTDASTHTHPIAVSTGFSASFFNFYTGGSFEVPVMGGSSAYSLAWAAGNASHQHRLEITGYTI